MKKSRKFIVVIFFCILLTCSLFIRPSTVFAIDTSALRLSGNDRYSTSVAISKNGWSKATTVIIASGLDFPDALSASALSKSKDAPILLTDTNALPIETILEIKRLKATQAIVVGGKSVISVNIENQLINLGVSITRVGGMDRYDTSKQVAKLLTTTNGVIIAAGSDFPDALSIATVAGIKSIPILLSPQTSLDPNISGFIQGKSIPVSYIVGGTGALSSAIDSIVPMSKRISGADRYATNLAILNQFSGSLNFDTAYLVSGDNFPDALCGAAIAAKNNAPVLLTDKNSISNDCINFLKNHNVKHVVILGGTGVVSQNVEDTISNLLVTISETYKTQTLLLHDSLKAEIISNMENRTTNFTFKWNGILQDCMDTANQIMKDIAYTNPYEYYNMSNMNLVGTEDHYGVTTTTLSFTMGYRTTKAEEDYVTSQINEILPKIISDSMSTANKELAIHDWIVRYAQYDESLTRYTAYDMLAEHSAVCQGYALLTYKMLTKAGIQSEIVAGTANNGHDTADHAWNLVNIDGSWYHLDTTWDDPMYSPTVVHSYFNLTDDQISKDHTWDKTAYPAVSKLPFVK